MYFMHMFHHDSFPSIQSKQWKLYFTKFHVERWESERERLWESERAAFNCLLSENKWNGWAIRSLADIVRARSHKHIHPLCSSEWDIWLQCAHWVHHIAIDHLSLSLSFSHCYCYIIIVHLIFKNLGINFSGLQSNLMKHLKKLPLICFLCEKLHSLAFRLILAGAI